MTGTIVIAGIYLSPIVPACVAALLLTIALSAVLTRTGFFRLTWHRPLVEVAIFCMLLTAVAVPLAGAGR